MSERIRFHFSKTEAMRFTGHLDLHKAWERSMRRSGLCLAYSQGFHPQPRIQLACALPLGFTSDCELVDIWLENEPSIDEINARLIPALPPGITVSGIEIIVQNEPTLQTQVIAAEYHITYPKAPQDINKTAQNILESSTLPRERRGKPYDLKPLLEHLEVQPGNTDRPTVFLVRLAARENATGRPEEVMAALGLEPTLARYHRNRLILKQAENAA